MGPVPGPNERPQDVARIEGTRDDDDEDDDDDDDDDHDHDHDHDDESIVLERMKQHFRPYCIFGDRGYTHGDPSLQVPFQGLAGSVEPGRSYNIRRAKHRISIEWCFGKIKKTFAFVDFNKNQKLALPPAHFRLLEDRDVSYQLPLYPLREPDLPVFPVPYQRTTERSRYIDIRDYLVAQGTANKPDNQDHLDFDCA